MVGIYVITINEEWEEIFDKTRRSIDWERARDDRHALAPKKRRQQDSNQQSTILQVLNIDVCHMDCGFANGKKYLVQH